MKMQSKNRKMRKKDRNSVVKVNKDRNYQTAVKTLEFKQIIINNS